MTITLQQLEVDFQPSAEKCWSILDELSWNRIWIHKNWKISIYNHLIGLTMTILSTRETIKKSTSNCLILRFIKQLKT